MLPRAKMVLREIKIAAKPYSVNPKDVDTTTTIGVRASCTTNMLTARAIQDSEIIMIVSGNCFPLRKAIPLILAEAV